jgi:hypothetical protein
MLGLMLIAALMAPHAQETKPVSPAPSSSREPPGPPARTEPLVSIEDEVLTNVKSQPLGAGTVGDLGAPDGFLRLVGDRIIRSSFEERYRVVVPDAVLEGPAANSDADGTGSAGAKPGPRKTGSAAEKQPMLVLLVATTALLALVAFAVIAIRGRSRSGP